MSRQLNNHPLLLNNNNESIHGEDSSDEDNSNFNMCVDCAGRPCDWIAFGHILIQDLNQKYSDDAEGNKIDNDGAIVSNGQLRKVLYWSYTLQKYGFLGKGTRIPLPKCVLTAIRDVFPDPNGRYMVFLEEWLGYCIYTTLVFTFSKNNNNK